MSSLKKPAARDGKVKRGLKTLAIDVGGSRLKSTVLDENGKMMIDPVRIKTPHPCPPEVLLSALNILVSQIPEYDRISVGFPGVVRNGRILACVNLGNEFWHGFNLEDALLKQFRKPVKVINDADMQGLGAIKGRGIELMITLGTGIGSGLFEDGRLAPHLEIGHAPFRKGETFEEQLGNQAYLEVGKQRWNRRLQRAIKYWRILTNFDKLYLGGGNAQHINFDPNPEIEIVSNRLGMIGGIWLWEKRRDEERKG